MRFARLLALALTAIAALALGGCASQTLSQEQSANIQRVGLVWLVPESATFEKVGITVFGNERSEFDLGEPLETAVAETLKAHLAQTRPAWRLETATYDRVALLRKMRSSSMVMSSALERIEADLAAVAAQNRLDALLVFSPTRWDNAPYFGGEGIGVWRRALPGIDHPILHANFELTVADVRGKVLAQGRSINYANPIRITTPGYARQVPTHPDELSRLRSDLRNLTLGNVRARADEVGL